MKNIFKTLICLIGFITVIGIIYFLFLFLEQKKYNNRVRKIAHINIYQKHPIKGLEYIDLKICDSIYKFKIKNIKDTISENIAISDKTFPCKVNIIYKFKNGTKTKYNVENFNCAGCSGSNIYVLTPNEVLYKYHP